MELASFPQEQTLFVWVVMLLSVSNRGDGLLHHNVASQQIGR